MAREQIVQRVNELCETSCIEVFEGLGCQIQKQEDILGDLGDAPMACIDAGSEDIEIMVLIQIPMSVLALTYPVKEEVTTVEDEELEDWISELSNRLIGSIKNKLIRHDCRVQIGLPNFYVGTEEDELMPDSYEKTNYYFDVDNEEFLCSVGIEVLNEAITFLLESDEDDSTGDGELELF